MLSKRGFTIIELMTALVLMGIVSTAVYTLLVNNQRLYRQQTQRIELNDNIRSAMAILPGDLRELDASDGDIIEMTDSSITYKAMRSLYVTCAQVNGGEIHLRAISFVGLRGVTAEFDSVLVYADLQTSLMSDDAWRHVNVTQVANENNCGGEASVKLSISPVIPSTDSALAEYPVRGFELVFVGRYVDAAGAVWLGARRFSKASGWSAIQPIVGPLQTRGFRLAYFDRAGVVTADPRQVARIRVTVVGRTAEPVRLNNGSMGYLADSLVTQIALRNNR